MIERAPGFLQPRAEPADRALAAGLRNGVECGADDLRLLLGRHLVEATRIALVVAHPFPAPLLAFLDDLRMVQADVAVECDGAADLVAVEHLHQPEHADAVAVIAHRPDRDVRDLARREAARARLEREELDVGNDPQRDPRAVGPFEPRTANDRRVRKRPVRTRLHGSTDRVSGGSAEPNPNDNRRRFSRQWKYAWRATFRRRSRAGSPPAR